MFEPRSSDVPAGSLALWWLGQSGFLVYFDGCWLCFDPYLSDSLTRKYAGTQKPHDRMYPIVVDPARLSFVDVATSTHNHTDHLDAETLLAMKPKRLVIPEANRAFVAQRLGCDTGWPDGLAIGESTTIAGFELTAVPAAHETLSPATVGYVVKVGSHVIYHSGDTLLFDGMADCLKPFNIDVALLPINGKVGNMNHQDAAWLAKEIGARLVIPCHYDMFWFNTANPADFAAAAEKMKTPYRILALGERIIYP